MSNDYEYMAKRVCELKDLAQNKSGLGIESQVAAEVSLFGMNKLHSAQMSRCEHHTVQHLASTLSTLFVMADIMNVRIEEAYRTRMEIMLQNMGRGRPTPIAQTTKDIESVDFSQFIESPQDRM